MLHRRRRGEEAEVRRIGEDEVPVRGPRGGGRDLAGQVVGLLTGCDRRTEQHHDAQGRERGGQQPTAPADPERAETATAHEVVPQQDAGDQEAGEGEELRDREEGTLGSREPAMEGEHGEHEQGPQPVETSVMRAERARLRATFGRRFLRAVRCGTFRRNRRAHRPAPILPLSGPRTSPVSRS